MRLPSKSMRRMYGVIRVKSRRGGAITKNYRLFTISQTSVIYAYHVITLDKAQ